jgi:hypothetical protein
LPDLEVHVAGIDPPPEGARVTVRLEVAASVAGEAWISGQRRSQDLTKRAVLREGRGRVRAPGLGGFSATLEIAAPGARPLTLPLRPEPAVITPDTHKITLRR